MNKRKLIEIIPNYTRSLDVDSENLIAEVISSVGEYHNNDVIVIQPNDIFLTPDGRSWVEISKILGRIGE